jgi:hypothetical protein
VSPGAVEAGPARAAPPSAGEDGPGATPPDAPAALAEGGEGREIGAHWFVTPFDGQTAIVATSFAFRQGISATGADFGDLRIQFYGYEQAMRLQVGIFNRVAVEAELGGVANVAGTPETLLAFAGIANLRAGGGARVRLFTWDPAGLQVAVGASAYYLRYVVISPITWIDESVVAGEIVSAESALIQSSALLVTPYAAFTVGRGPIGLQASATPAVLVASGSSTVGLELAAQLELDVGRVSPVPLALVAGYSRQASPEEDQGAFQRVSAGLWYSGRRSFAIGLVGFYGFQVLEPEGADSTTLTSPGGAMAFQYFW